MKNILKIKGAKTHNLKNINLEIPKNKLVVFTGVSGSGKSSLVFDTIYSEGQRRYVESLSSYARQFLGVMDKPNVDSIEGISPAIAIDQKSVSKNPRSTVGTITEIYDYLRLLFAHIGKPYCPNCNILIESSSPQEISEVIKKFQLKADSPQAKKGQSTEVIILAPLVSGKKGEHKAILQEVSGAGFMRARVDGNIMVLDEAILQELDPKKKHSIEVVVDRMEINVNLDKIRLLDSIETGLKTGKGMLLVLSLPPVRPVGKNITPTGQTGGVFTRLLEPTGQTGGSDEYKEYVFSEKFACPNCAFSMREVEPRTFSFNSPYGACVECSGLGAKMEVDPELVIPNKNLTIEEGAIKPWMGASHRVGRQGWYWMMLSRMSKKYNFSMSVQAKDLSKDAMQIILYGDSEIEGVIPNLERRYKDTESEYTRAEIEKYMNIRDCPLCEGKRLREEALAVKILSKNIHDTVIMNINEAHSFFKELTKDRSFNPGEKKIMEPIVKEIVNRLSFLQKVGLHYLTLSRQAGTLSGGEAQRIQLATQLGSHLAGVLYILDEPSIGLHARDQKRLIDTMKELRDLGSSVLVVEHDPLTIQQADYIIDIGPGAGRHGGKIVFKGTFNQLLKSKSLTAGYISGKKKVTGMSTNGKLQMTNNTQKPNTKNPKAKTKLLTVKGVKHNNLKNIDFKIPLSKLVCVTGVSGSGKSSLVNDVLAKALKREFHNAHTIPGKHKTITGLNNLDKAVLIDQSPIGRTPRSNPATYTNVFTPIRELFAALPESRARGYKPGRFSFNVKGGRCSGCRGGGVTKVEMFFMSDIYIECETCGGKRYNKEVLEIKYKGKDIQDVLEMTVNEACKFFENIPYVKSKLDVLVQVGLGYIHLGQQAPSLSGGEAQRVKLATELARRATGQTLYILDEPTTGLHPDDINKLLSVLKDLVAGGNTVLVIEHNLDVVKNADWIVDLGPEGGDEGGEIVAEGTPAQIAEVAGSYTGQYLRKV